MALSAFDDKAKKPNKRNLTTALGRTSIHWDSLIVHIASEYAPLDKTWNHAGAAWGWSLRLKQKKRTVLYMTPCRGHFLVGFVLGEKAVKLAQDSKLPDAVLSVINSAKKYAEGRAVRLEVRNKKDLESVKKIAAIKMTN
jgi:hypothetical protein